ncbi:MAG: SGNH/GDSL hydrolase family protein [Lachnospiraceae bacterium]|nr:SGNH/GDSL hydrolase family protein [Lachnospiraceae bacterium]
MRVKRETVEWVKFMSVETEKHDLPRVLLVGDSITDGYFRAVAERLNGECYVDYLAVAYSVDMPIYHRLVMMMVRENKYDVIHFNHGLHCGHMKDIGLYQSKTEELLRRIGTDRIILANSTIAYQPKTMIWAENWKNQLPKLNAAVDRIAENLNLPLNDLFTVSAGLKEDGLSGDGLHYSPIGYCALADAVAGKIRDFLKAKKA